MEIFEQKDVLKSFEILVDTREQNTERARKRYAAFNAPYSRTALNYGDYGYNATLPDGRKIFDTSASVKSLCCIERKMNLDELAQCFTHSRERFVREFQRAKEAGASIYLICENASWENLYNGRYKSKFNANAFVGSLNAFMVRYNCPVLFCKEETSGRLIRDILYRDLKERLERGEFDKQ